jgi:hypothetical protein
VEAEAGADRPGPAARLEREDRVGEGLAEEARHLAPGRERQRGGGEGRIAEGGGVGARQEPREQRGRLRRRARAAPVGVHKHLAEGDPRLLPVRLRVRLEPGLERRLVGLRGREILGDELELLAEPAPDDGVVLPEPHRDRLARRYLLPDPLGHEAAELLVAGRAQPRAGEAGGELLLARGRDDDAVPPAARAAAEKGRGGEEGRADDDEVE